MIFNYIIAFILSILVLGQLFAIVELITSLNYLLASAEDLSIELIVQGCIQICLRVLSFLFFSIAVFFLIRLRKRHIKRQLNIFYNLVAFVGVFLPVSLAFRFGAPLFSVSIYVSVFLMIVGITISFIGLVTLRRNFSVLPQVIGLTQTGIYKYVRHPMYLGASISVLGVLLINISVINICLYIIFLLTLYCRVRWEENILLQEFEEYREYRGRVGAMIPR